MLEAKGRGDRPCIQIRPLRLLTSVPPEQRSAHNPDTSPRERGQTISVATLQIERLSEGNPQSVTSKLADVNKFIGSPTRIAPIRQLPTSVPLSPLTCMLASIDGASLPDPPRRRDPPPAARRGTAPFRSPLRSRHIRPPISARALRRRRHRARRPLPRLGHRLRAISRTPCTLAALCPPLPTPRTSSHPPGGHCCQL